MLLTSRKLVPVKGTTKTIEELDKKLVYYYATIFSGDDNDQKIRFHLGHAGAAILNNAGIACIEPIAGGFPKMQFGLPGNFEHWHKLNTTFIEHASGGIIVLWFEGITNKSRGVAAEIKFAEEHNPPIPVYYYEFENWERDVQQYMLDKLDMHSIEHVFWEMLLSEIKKQEEQKEREKLDKKMKAQSKEENVIADRIYFNLDD